MLACAAVCETGCRNGNNFKRSRGFRVAHGDSWHHHPTTDTKISMGRLAEQRAKAGMRFPDVCFY